MRRNAKTQNFAKFQIVPGKTSDSLHLLYWLPARDNILKIALTSQRFREIHHGFFAMKNTNVKYENFKIKSNWNRDNELKKVGNFETKKLGNDNLKIENKKEGDVRNAQNWNCAQPLKNYTKNKISKLPTHCHKSTPILWYFEKKLALPFKIMLESCELLQYIGFEWQ